MENKSAKLPPALYIAPTPIGNLEDITVRALKVLASADIIACEDTRKTGQALKIYKIEAKELQSYHEYNEADKAPFLVNEILSGKSVALVSDAGTPGISDPGYRIIAEAISRNVKVVPLPGATAFVPALVASGLGVSRFAFLGFPPQKKGRQGFLKTAANYDMPVVLYESPHRIPKLLEELEEICGGNRKICLCRELSKIHEEFFRGSVAEAVEHIKKAYASKGEFVVIIGEKSE